jgi:uncharacterized protein YdbL (DUF1318 family)
MRKLYWAIVAFGLTMMSACVTINVYFPAAAAEEAANEFIDKVIGDDAPPSSTLPPQAAVPRSGFSALAALFAVIPAANAQANLDIETPAIKAIQARMAERFQSTLQAHFDKGALGLTRDGMIAVRDAAALPLSARAAVNQAVADDNRDRDAVYREIAVANGHPEWEQEIRETFARQWIERAHGGWYYQDSAGAWKRK